MMASATCCTADSPPVVIVGAGIFGLTAAYWLHRELPAVPLLVLESASRPGGKVWTERQGGFQLELGPNAFTDQKGAVLHLCEELGLRDYLLPASPAARQRYLVQQGQLCLVPTDGRSFLQSRLLSSRAKLALLLERFRRSPPRGEESLRAFCRRRFGKEAGDLLADALATGIWAGDADRLSAPAAFPRLTALERTYGSLWRGLAAARRQAAQDQSATGQAAAAPAGRLWSLRQGLRQLIETLVAHLPQPPLLGESVRRLMPHPESRGWLLQGTGQERWSAAAVLLACPAYEQAALLADLDLPLAEQLAAIPYNRLTVVGLGYRASDAGRLEGFGYLSLPREGRPLLGVQWCSSLFPERAPPGHILLRALVGGWHRPEIAAWDEERLLAAVRAELQQLQGIRAAPCWHYLQRWERALPQYLHGHLQRLQSIQQRLQRYPGLFLGGNAFHGVALNDCVEHAQQLAAQLAQFVRSRYRWPVLQNKDK